MTPATTGAAAELPQKSADDLARDMIEVHGSGAADIARDNARRAALAGQAAAARNWLHLLDIVQRMARAGAGPGGGQRS